MHRRPILLVLLINAFILSSLSFVTPALSETKDGDSACRLLDDKDAFPRDPVKVVPPLLKKAGVEILELRRSKDFDLSKKSNFADLKTKGDCTSQKLIFKALKKVYPRHRFLGEEKCGNAGKADESSVSQEDILWILDPIDGTTNYAHGLSHFNISLALVVGGEVCYGAVYAPVFEELYYAEKGKGAFLEDRKNRTHRLHVSSTKDFSESLWVTGFKAGHKKKVDANVPLMREVLLNSHGIRRPGSAALDLAHVAAGRIEGYWELFMDWWDIAAGLLLVEEAGGKSYIIYPKGSPKRSIDYQKPTRAAMASNGKGDVHKRMVGILSSMKEK